MSSVKGNIQIEVSSKFTFRCLKETYNLELTDKLQFGQFNSNFNLKSQFENYIKLNDWKLKEIENSKVEGNSLFEKWRTKMNSMFRGISKLESSRKLRNRC